MSDIFGDLNQMVQSPYVDLETNEKVKKSLMARLGNVKEVIYLGEEGETPATMADFMELLSQYRFQGPEVKNMEKGDIVLFDGDYYLVAKF